MAEDDKHSIMLEREGTQTCSVCANINEEYSCSIKVWAD